MGKKELVKLLINKEHKELKKKCEKEKNIEQGAKIFWREKRGIWGKIR